MALNLAWLASGRGLASAQDVVQGPRLDYLPDLAVPAEFAPPDDGLVEAIVDVAADGTARMTGCHASAKLCSFVAQAIAAAQFEPARRQGQPVAARIRLGLRLTRAETSPAIAQPASRASEPQRPPPSAAELQEPAVVPSTVPDMSALPDGSASPPAYGARAKVQPKQAAGMRRLELAETRDLPGSLGDPFRAVDTLPGVVPVLSGLPYFYVRGSPPAGTIYVYDDIPMPTLYHLAIGPAVLHPRMVGPIRLYSGVAPARYGRLTGGVVVGEGPGPGDGQAHAEAELRLLDLSGYVQTSALGGTLTAAARYGYPALLLAAINPNVKLSYWDYQFRYATELSPHDRLELVALGSYDAFAVADEPADAVRIAFHRGELRLVRRVGRAEFGSALLAGWEQSTLGSEFQVRATRIGPRLWYEQRLGAASRLRLSADMQAVAGRFSSHTADGGTATLPEEVGLFGDVPARSLWGIQAELGVRPWRALEVQLGARADAWVQLGSAEAVLDPRLRVIVHASDAFELHIAAGVVHQPAVFFLPLPGVVDVANDRGLQSAVQSELGLGWDTALGMRAELQAFVHRYSNLVFTDTLLLGDKLESICHSIECHGAGIPSRINGLSYGGELFLRRAVTERISGFLSYTLAWSAVDRIAGLHYTPSWDVRHIANLVLQWRIVGGFSLGLRWFVRSGKSSGDFLVDNTARVTRQARRLPRFMRLDLEASYQWQPAWGRMRIALEWLNVTLAREPQDVTCAGFPRSCQVNYLPTIFFPNLSIRGEH